MHLCERLLSSCTCCLPLVLIQPWLKCPHIDQWHKTYCPWIMPKPAGVGEFLQAFYVAIICIKHCRRFGEAVVKFTIYWNVFRQLRTSLTIVNHVCSLHSDLNPLLHAGVFIHKKEQTFRSIQIIGLGLDSMRSPAFSSEPKKPVPWWTGDLTPSVLHRKLEISRWNRRACQAATEPAWQCRRPIHHPSQQNGQELDQALLIGSAIAVCQCPASAFEW